MNAETVPSNYDSSSDTESSTYEDNSDEFVDPVAEMPVDLLQRQLGQKYSYLASQPQVRGIIRKTGFHYHRVGDERFLSKRVLHGSNSLDTIVRLAIMLTRTLDPDWNMEIMRLKTISKFEEPVFPYDFGDPDKPTPENPEDAMIWRKVKREFIVCPQPKVTMYLYLDDAWKEEEFPVDKPLVRPCEAVRRPAFERPTDKKVLMKWQEELFKTGKSMYDQEEEKEESDVE
ncbi:hypothetical protein WDU94_014425 [Cyamophila willieti]